MKNELGFNHRLVTKDDCALIIVDEQDRLMPVIAGREVLIQNALRLLKFSQLLDIPVVITEQEKLGPTLSEVKVGIRPIGKVHFNCFMSEEFEHTLQQLERKILILAGVEAHICVTQTALHALQSYKVHIVADAIGSRTADNRDVAIERMRQAGAIITSTEMFIYEVLQRAGTDKFKAALQLVK